MTIAIKTAADIDGMRIAGRLAAEVLDMLTPHVVPGISTEALDKLAHDYMVNVQADHPGTTELRPSGLRGLIPNRSARRSITRSATAFRTNVH